MLQAVNGMTIICEKEIPYSFDVEKEKITVYSVSVHARIPKGLDTIVGQKFGMLTGGKTLYKLSVPLSTEGVSICNQIGEVEYYIDDYVERSRYKEMRLRFPELDYLLPSMGKAKCEDDCFVFSRVADPVSSFDIKYRGATISVAFIRASEAQVNVNTTATTFSEILLRFPETDDLEYITDLYFTVRGFFEFICNRKNIGLRSAVLVGDYPRKKIENGKVVDKLVNTRQTLFLSQKYLEPTEDIKQIKKTPNIGLFNDKLQDLLQLFFEKNNGDFAIVNGSGSHPSIKFRNLIDLEQSLHITAAFEYYVRTLLPEISSQETSDFLEDVRALLDGYIANATGMKKKRAKDFKKSLRPQITLKDKVLKVYCGYDNWKDLRPILSEWFGEDVSELAIAANLWRNELAHEKREYQPDVKVIIAVRLVEHLNYCIILRHAGYSDEAIKLILEEVLTR